MKPNILNLKSYILLLFMTVLFINTQLFAYAKDSNNTHLSDSGGYFLSTENIEKETTAGNEITLYPDIKVDGNSRNYLIEWFCSEDNGASWKKIIEKRATTAAELKYTYYADCSQTFSKYKYRLTNEAGTVESGSLTTFVYEKYSIKENHLTIESTGYVDGKNPIVEKMNNYSDPRWKEKTAPWKKEVYTEVTINNHIASVGEEAFKDNKNLKHATLSAEGDIIEINNASFENTGLLGITVPDSVERVKKYAFKSCENLRDIRFLGKTTLISEEIGTIPETKVNVDGYDKTNDIYNRKHGYPIIYGYSGGEAEKYVNKLNSGTQISYNFVPIDDSNGKLIEWNYSIVKKADTIENLYTETPIIGEFTIPKSIDGYLIEEIGNIQDSNGIYRNLFGKEVHEDDEIVETTDGITSIRLLDNIKNIGISAITNCPNLKTIYNESVENQTFLNRENETLKNTTIYNNGNDVALEAAIVYLYSNNHEFEEQITKKYTRIFYDKALSGTTKDISWVLNMQSNTLTASKFKGSSYTDEPFDWAVEYIEKINIMDDIVNLPNELFLNMVNVYSIKNKSNQIESVGENAFLNVGANTEKEKVCTTYVNNHLYDSIIKNGTQEPFKFVFETTTQSCGSNTIGINSAEFYYDASSGDLMIRSQNNSETESHMESYTEESIPWRCVKSYIKTISIEKNVKTISNNSFTNLPNLKMVYNKGKNQKIVGKGELFDVMDRYIAKENHISGTEILISKPIDYDFLWKQLYDIGFKTITVDELRSLNIIAGKHIINSLMKKEALFEQLETDTRYIVPVHTYINENADFVNGVPQPETKGYRLESIYMDSGKCGDDLYWYLYKDGILEIEGTGDMYDFDENTDRAPWNSYKNSIFTVIISKKATRIGSYAFDGLSEVITIEVPEKIKSIGVGAFQNSSIERFALPYNVEKIDGAIFTGCNKLRFFTGSDVNFIIVDGILYNRDQTILIEYLRDQIYKPNSYDPYEKLNELTISESVIELAEKAFYKNATLNRIYMPSSVKKIGNKSLAGMDKLYFIDCKTGEYDTVKENVQEVMLNALENTAQKYPSREVLIYKANTQFIKTAEEAGFNIRYYDSMNIDHINAHYAGSEIVIGETIPLKDVVFDIVFASGFSETTSGDDSRFSVNGSMTITNIGDNIFTATYRDGYTDPVETREFIVPGVNRITKMAARYNGLDVWYGEKLAPSNVMISLQYANGDTKTIAGTSEYLSYSDMVIDKLDTNSHSGKKEIIVTYNDGQNKVFSDTINVACSDYIESISASYQGDETIESTAGINGLTDSIKDDILIDLKWKSSNAVETITGSNGAVSFSGGSSVVNGKLQIVVGYDNFNRYDKTAVVNISCASNVKDVTFTYVGGLITKGTSLNLSNIMVNVFYADGRKQSFKADTVDNLTADPMIINNYGANTVTVTYSPPGFTKTGDIIVMGTIAVPIKLIITERPKKTVYQAGELFERNGLRVNCLYDNGEIQDVSDLVEIENETALTEETKSVTISYTENRDGSDHVVKTYLAININQNQKALLRKKTFKESYEINRILFRSKKTEDVSGAEEEDSENDDEGNGKWTEIVLNDASKGESTDLSASIKAGYGFELKVYTNYKTTRGSNEFKDFMTKAQWDDGYENPEDKTANPNGWKTAYVNESDYKSVADYIAHKDDWDYLNDIYPQHVPTANPDLMYVRIIKRSADAEDQFTQINGKNFIVMDKTNQDEKNQIIDEGEWYNSQKIFEFPLRTVDENGNIINTEDENGGDRRVYVSREAAESDSANTEYIIQILSPAWYGYESEPAFDELANQFIINDEEAREGIVKNWHNGDAYKYLHVAYEFSLFVQKNDDIHTHILQ